jgi:REP element-mobilizing transposase RayT
MTHNYTYLLTHIVFGTWDCAPIISPDIRPSLFEYMGGIVREIEAVSMTINGMPDHVHLLVSMPPKLAVADVVRVVKANSSRWVHEKWPTRKGFAWQGGYGAFSVSQSMAEKVGRYIDEQEEHHRTMSFEQEYRGLLRKHGIEFEERYLW